MLELNKIYNIDCLVGMKKMFEQGLKVDAIIADIPYGTTACEWDSVIPLYEMFQAIYKIRKDVNTPIVLFGSQPFTSELIRVNIAHHEGFKHEWIYKKRVGSNFAQAKYAPIKEHENIVVFGQKGHRVNYYPIKEKRAESGKKRIEAGFKYDSEKGGDVVGGISRNNTTAEYDKNLRYPSSVQEFNNRAKGARGFHPTQKPIELMEYLVQTYTREGEVVLDFTIGSGTTAIACINTNRNFIGFELDENYYRIANERIKQTLLEKG